MTAATTRQLNAQTVGSAMPVKRVAAFLTSSLKSTSNNSKFNVAVTIISIYDGH